MTDRLSSHTTFFILAVLCVVLAALFSAGVSLLPQMNQGNIYRFRDLHVGESLGDEVRAVTADEWPALRGGIVHTGEGQSAYTQSLIFKDGTDIPSGKVVFAKDENGDVADYVHFKQGDDMFEYKLDFSEGLLTSVESDGTVRSLEGQRISILGEDFTVVRATADTTTHRISISLMGGRSLDALPERTVRPYLIDGKEYNVGVVTITDTTPPRVMFVVDGQTTPPLKEGEAAVLPDGLEIGVRALLPNEATEAGGSDLVETYIGATEVTLTDDDYTDNDFALGVRIAKRDISDAKVRIRATGTDDSFALFSIEYRLEASSDQGDVFVPEGQGLRSSIRYPEAMLSDAWDLKYQGVSAAADTSTVRFDPSGSEGYRLTFENVRGRRYRVPFIDASGTFKYGSGDKSLVYFEAGGVAAPNIRERDYFVLNDGNTDRSQSHIMQYSSFDSDGRITFTDLAGGSLSATFSTSSIPGVLGEAQLMVGGNSYKVYVGPSGDLAIDQNRDGSVDGGKAYITIMGGGLLDLGSAQDISALSEFNATVTTPKRNIKGATNDETVNIGISRSGAEVDLNVPSQSDLNLTSEKGTLSGMTRYGAFYQQGVDTGRPDRLDIVYPQTQGIAQVMLVGP